MNKLTKTILQALTVGIVLSAPCLFAESGVGATETSPKKQPAQRDRITDDALRANKLLHQQGFARAQKTSAKEPSTNLTKSVYKESVILTDGKNHTVLPKGSVIHTPSAMTKHRVTSPVGKYVPWPEFYLSNRNWLFTYSVTLPQAMGEQPITKQVKNQFQKMNRVIVALLQHNPVSVLPGKTQTTLVK